MDNSSSNGPSYGCATTSPDNCQGLAELRQVSRIRQVDDVRAHCGRLDAALE